VILLYTESSNDNWTFDKNHNRLKKKRTVPDI